MVSTAEPELAQNPYPINPIWFGRGCVLGAIGGAAIALGFVFALALAGQDDWSTVPGAVILGLPAGGFVGLIDATLALGVLRVLPRRLLATRWLAGLIAGATAAVPPVYLTFHAGYPSADGGIWIGLGLSLAAFVAGFALTPIALRPRSAR